MTPEENNLNKRIAKLERVVLQMTKTIRVLTKNNEDAAEFVAAIEEIANSIVVDDDER